MLQSSLVEQNAESGELRMHRMARLIYHIKMSQERQESFLGKALAIYGKGGVMYHNEIFRSTYRLGCVL
jgi:hypothetical protein